MSLRVFSLFAVCLVGLGLVAGSARSGTLEEREVYYFNDPYSDLKLYHAPEGLKIVWANSGGAGRHATFGQGQYAEGVAEIAFDLDVARNNNTTIQLCFDNRFGDHFTYTLSPADSAVGRHSLKIPVGSFQGRYSGKYAKGDEIANFNFALSGERAKIAANVTQYVVLTNHGDSYRLFDAALMPSPFPPSRLYPHEQKPMFVGERRPRVFVAGGGEMENEGFEAGLTKIAAQFPGSFGIDFGAYWTFPATAACVEYYNSKGIKTICETHKTAPYFTSYLAYNDDFLVNSSGVEANDLNANTFPYHGEDVTTRDVVNAVEAKIAECAREGFSEFLLIDYMWPWNGRWGYGPKTIAAFRADLNGADPGIYMLNGAGTYSRQNFWDYLKIFTDAPISPSDIGLESWESYKPVREPEASRGSIEKKKNLFLFAALWHYEYLKFLQEEADYAHSRGILLYPTVNPEDPMNGTDLYVMALLRNLDKVGYEFFGNPGGTIAWYHDMRWYAQNLRKQGKDISNVEEINDGGHGPSKYNWDAAYAFHYDLTSSAKPIDYNNQYLEGDWTKIPKSDVNQFGRYAHWEAGALAFMQSFAESENLQPAKPTVLVASRGILEYQPGFANGMGQTGNIGGLLDQLHIPFDSAGKEQFAAYVADAKTLIYCPAESSPMHFNAVRDWLDRDSGKVLVMHSFVPFSFANNLIGLNPGITSDLTWAGKPNWNNFHSNGTLSENKTLSLSLKNITSGAHVSLTVKGQTFSASRDAYQLAPSPGIKTVLASNEGIPLISRIAHGANQIVYINVRTLPADLTKNTEFDRQLLLKAMEIAEVRPEADAPARAAVHLYDVPGGRSAVLWDVSAMPGQDARHFYTRAPLAGPMDVTVTVLPNTSYTLYQFYADQSSTIVSGADGKLALPMSNTVEMYYYGQSNNAAFQAVLAKVRRTRATLRDFEPGVF